MKIKAESDLKKQVFKGFLWMLSGSGIQTVMQFVVLIVLARLLDPESFGIVSAALVVISFTVILSTLGFGPALVQKQEIHDEHIGTSYTVSLLFAVIFGTIIYILAPFIANFFHIEDLTLILRVLTVVFIFQGLSIVSESLIQREMLFALMVRIQVISYFCYGAVGVILAVFGFGVWSLVFAYMGQLLVKSILSIFYQPYKIRFSYSHQSFKELFYFSGGYALAKLSAEISSQGDNLIIGRFLGPGALGLYSRAYQLMVMPANVIGKVFETVLFPAMSKIQDNPMKLTYVYSEGIRITTTLMLPASVFLFMNAERIILLLFGDQWIDLTRPFQFLAIALLFRSSYKISDSLAKAKGAVYHRAVRKWLYAILIVLGSYIGQFQGLVGVAIGVSVAILVNYLMMAQLVHQLIGIRLKTILNLHVGGGILALLVWSISMTMDSYLGSYLNNYVIELLLYIVLYLIINFVTILIAPTIFVGENGSQYIKKIIKTIGRRQKVARVKEY